MTTPGLIPPGDLHFCSICTKPYTSFTAHRRHETYCRRVRAKVNHRPRSCQTCNTSKVKCSFETPCSRCVKRGLNCVYEYRPVRGQVPGAHASRSRATLDDAISLETQAYLHGLTPSNDSASAAAESYPVFDTISGFEQSGSGIDTLQEDLMWQSPNLSDVDSLSMSQEIMIPDMLQSPGMDTDLSNYLVRITPEKPLVRQNANLILEALCAIPEQMLRRNTLPPFIHPHWHLPDMPKPLAVCMEIALLFSRRTPATLEYLWRTVLAESRRAVEQITIYSAEDLLAAVQAGMVYVIMRVVDGPMLNLEWNREMALYQNILCTAFLDLHDGKFCESEAENPSTSWKQWIFAESRRRTSCVWFLVARTIMIKDKPGCPTTEAPWTLPLPSPKTEWEARTVEDWFLEIDAGTPAINDFGSLIEARQNRHEPVHARKLDSWNARTDTLGSLLNIAVSMV